MPCRDDYPSLPATAAEKRAVPLLCSACRALDRLGYDFDENPELSEWWAKHKAEDDARAIREQHAKDKLEWERHQVKTALSKNIAQLTEEEKVLLRKYKYL